MGTIYYECRDLMQPAGGVRRLYRHVEILNKHGFSARILHHRPGFKLKWFQSDAPVSYSSAGLKLGPDDVLVIPEGHTNVMVATALNPCRRVVIALNWANIYRSLPVGLDWRALGLSEVIAGSEYEREFVKRSMGLESTVIVSGTDGKMFKPAPVKLRQVAYMPRKNEDVFHLIASVFRSRFPEFAGIPFVPVHGLAHREVSQVLGESACFLATSFPEGLARPPLEAMACGCLVVGFAGRGSLEYMDHLRNCYLAEDMDVLGAAEMLGLALRQFEQGDCLQMQSAALETALRYSLEREERTVVRYWTDFLARPRQHIPTDSNVFEQPALLDDYSTLPFDGVYDRVAGEIAGPGIAVEIGPGAGGSTAYFARRIKQGSKKLRIVAVDTFTAAGDNSRPGNGGVAAPCVFQLFCDAIRRSNAADCVTPILGDLCSSVALFPDHSLDFIYFRGCGDHDPARRALLAWLPKLKPESPIAGEADPGIVAAVRGLFGQDAMETMGSSWFVRSPLHVN
jgi:hypothetical protein